ncbi:PIN-like domain-containing protein [Amycolatopsis sp. NPDC051373]|uniref:PIN-like domain-containing protein n=1 Tax=Amycolatopsis sp. NPDC051373 TaxID=3155801 RepID=UPI00344B0143
MSDPLLVERFAAWLKPQPSPSDEERAGFFRDGLIVLDTNVLLSLYEYTETSREEVLSALGRTQGRLWMPYQVGLEFVRGRRSTLDSRMRALGDAAKQVNQKLMAARRAIVEAKVVVRAHIEKFSRAPEAIAELESVVAEKGIDEQLALYRREFKRHLDLLKSDHDLELGSADAEDPILARVAQLYGDAIGEKPEDSVLRERVEEAATFRFPNKIPPGYADSGKGTQLRSAGDFLIWEELVAHVSGLSNLGKRILFVSNDTKEDWYDPGLNLRESQPWPSLIDEMKRRGKGELRIETPLGFYGGIREYLDAELAENTYAEIGRVSEDIGNRVSEPQMAITEEVAPHVEPPEGLAISAFHSVGLVSATVRAAVESTSARWAVFRWWLIGATAQLERRAVEVWEPGVEIQAAVRGKEAPSAGWQPGSVLPVGEWLHRSDSWIALWFLDLLANVPPVDRDVLCGLAAQQAQVNLHAKAGN